MKKRSFGSKNELAEINHFNKMAEDYDINYGYKNEFTQYKITKKIKELQRYIGKGKSKENLKILDLGCGTGEYTKKIAEIYPKSKVIGLDVSEKLLKIARQKCKKCKNAKFISRTAYDTKFKDGIFDVVTGFYFLHHVNVELVAKEVDRILKKRGKAFFYEPNILNPVVYLIKTNGYFKKLAGDSPGETAVNPLKIRDQMRPLFIEKINMSEYIFPVSFLPYSVMFLLDKLTIYLNKIPLIKYMGGSVYLLLRKYNG